MPHSWKISFLKFLPKVSLRISLPFSWIDLQIDCIKHSHVLCTLHNMVSSKIVTYYSIFWMLELTLIMMKLDLEKSFDHLSWYFLSQIIYEMGFGSRYHNLFSSLVIMLNHKWGINFPFSLTQSWCQGFPLSHLFFAIVIGPMLSLLEKLAHAREILSLCVLWGKPWLMNDWEFTYRKVCHIFA